MVRQAHCAYRDTPTKVAVRFIKPISLVYNSKEVGKHMGFLQRSYNVGRLERIRRTLADLHKSEPCIGRNLLTVDHWPRILASGFNPHCVSDV